MWPKHLNVSIFFFQNAHMNITLCNSKDIAGEKIRFMFEFDKHLVHFCRFAPLAPAGEGGETIFQYTTADIEYPAALNYFQRVLISIL